MRKLHREAVGAQIAPELLPKQHLDIGLVIDHEQVHWRRIATRYDRHAQNYLSGLALAAIMCQWI